MGVIHQLGSGRGNSFEHFIRVLFINKRNVDFFEILSIY